MGHAFDQWDKPLVLSNIVAAALGVWAVHAR